MRILIAEDDMTSRRFLSKLLSQYGECDVVVDGMEALDAYLISVKEQNAYEVIFLDIMMPKVDGVKVLKAIRDFEMQRGLTPDNRTKIIMITALSETQYVNEALQLGCDAYAAKPINIEKLLKVMKKLKIVKI